MEGNKILLTFDLEEFDLPLEYGTNISREDQLTVTNDGLKILEGLLEKYNVNATFFTTAYFATENSEIVKTLSCRHEIASHGKSHSVFNESDYAESRIQIEKVTGKKVHGFRMPRFRKLDSEFLSLAGYSYDSSLNPTYLPGRYNNFFSDRKIRVHDKNGLIEIPVSVSPVIRFPLFWLSFKILPFFLYRALCVWTIGKDKYLHLYFHPWEFADLKMFNIPGYVRNNSGLEFTGKFEKLVVMLKEAGEFSTLYDFLTVSGYEM